MYSLRKALKLRSIQSLPVLMHFCCTDNAGYIITIFLGYLCGYYYCSNDTYVCRVTERDGGCPYVQWQSTGSSSSSQRLIVSLVNC